MYEVEGWVCFVVGVGSVIVVEWLLIDDCIGWFVVDVEVVGGVM